MSDWKIKLANDHIVGEFFCMASPCELLIEGKNKKLAKKLTSIAFEEAKRIEQKYSRYRTDNLVHRLNSAKGTATQIDSETFQLLSFADTCYQISDGMFDITSGVLRKAWKFDGSDKVPQKSQVDELKPYLGWEHLYFDKSSVQMPSGFELDFGGIGKEYAVDCVAKKCQAIAPNTSVLVNFGGDIQVTCPRKNTPYWLVGVEVPETTNQYPEHIPSVHSTSNTADKQSEQQAPTSNTYPRATKYKKAMVKIAQGGLATSGDANRFLYKDGIRYSHVLDPKTAHPVKGAPRSVTVASDHCIQAGLLATLALLQGERAEAFLKDQEVTYWCYW